MNDEIIWGRLMGHRAFLLHNVCSTASSVAEDSFEEQQQQLLNNKYEDYFEVNATIISNSSLACTFINIDLLLPQ